MEIVNKSGRFEIVGNTYPIKDKIKLAGGRWDPLNKVWYFHSLSAAESIFPRVEKVEMRNVMPKIKACSVEWIRVEGMDDQPPKKFW